MLTKVELSKLKKAVEHKVVVLNCFYYVFTLVQRGEHAP